MSSLRRDSRDRQPLLETVDRIQRSGKITLEDRKRFNDAIYSEDLLSSDEQVAVQDTIGLLARGLLQVVD
ncbi:MAG: hypothetical protein SVX43_10790 [Cyanobacteriota bacterium]|nr:hypothetical protein [Cyanobacteriota bacterium]